jgi:ankyrin repeat protein
MLIWLLTAALLAPAAADLRLINAARERDTAAVRALLKEKVDVNAPQGDGATALHWAAHWNDVELAALLIGAGANASAADDHRVTPLTLACLNASPAMVRTLLEAGANPNAPSVVGETPLMVAAHTGNVDVVRLLLTRGADPGARETTAGQTALMRAVAQGHAAVVRLLLDSGADVKARSTNRFTPLLFAAQQGNVEIGRMLVAAGADVNESAPDGIAGDTNSLRSFKPNTEAAALLVAIDSGHPAMARFLIEQRAPPNHKGAGRTALHSAVQQQMPDVVRALLAHGADPNARLERPMPLLSRAIVQQHGLEVGTTGATPFWLAASYGDVPMMRLLVEAGADPKLTTTDRTTALMVAAGMDFVEGQDKYGRRMFTFDTTPIQARAMAAVQYCLDLGLDINAANDRGHTAAHGGVYFGGKTMMPFMVERGAKLDVVNKLGQTPWRIAAIGEYRSGSFMSYPETADLLLKLGADPKVGSWIVR